jgi:hypothetical protein
MEVEERVAAMAAVVTVAAVMAAAVMGVAAMVVMGRDFPNYQSRRPTGLVPQMNYG